MNWSVRRRIEAGPEVQDRLDVELALASWSRHCFDPLQKSVTHGRKAR
jgi:hypothetical protein